MSSKAYALFICVIFSLFHSIGKRINNWVQFGKYCCLSNKMHWDNEFIDCWMCDSSWAGNFPEFRMEFLVLFFFQKKKSVVENQFYFVNWSSEAVLNESMHRRWLNSIQSVSISSPLDDSKFVEVQYLLRHRIISNSNQIQTWKFKSPLNWIIPTPNLFRKRRKKRHKILFKTKVFPSIQIPVRIQPTASHFRREKPASSGQQCSAAKRWKTSVSYSTTVAS